MAAFVAVPLGPARDAHGPDANAQVRVLRAQNSFWTRQITISRRGVDYLELDSMRQAREGILDLLEVQLPFMVKVVLHYEISEESLEGQAIFSERRMATVPFLARPLANPDQRLGRVISVVRQEFEQHLEHARWNNSLQTFEGFITIQIYSTPSRELAQLPAAPGRNFDGGCWKELPEILRQGNKGLWSPKNEDHNCFRYCVTADVVEDVGNMTPAARKRMASCTGLPFFPNRSGCSGGRPQKNVAEKPWLDWGIDFSTLPKDAPISLEDVERFEVANSGRLEIFVYQWSKIPWLGTEYQYLLPLRSPAVDGEKTVLLLLHESHYVLIYDLNKLSSVRSGLATAGQQQHHHVTSHRCHRCLAIFSKPDVLKRHLVANVCHQEPGARKKPSLQLPDPKSGASKMHFRASPALEPHPCVVYADFEVFSEPSSDRLRNLLVSKQHQVASSIYVAVGRAGYEVPGEHLCNLTRSTVDGGPFEVVERFLRSLLHLACHYKAWLEESKPINMDAESRRRFSQARRCAVCCVAFANDEQRRKVAHHDHGTGLFRAALCNSCNLRVQRRKTLRIYFHNGSSYDFHFILRYLAHLHTDGVAVEESESLEAEASEDEGDFDDWEPAGDPWTYDLRKLKHSVLMKGGEKCLLIRLGPLEFLDSMNVFPAGLGDLIDDLKSTAGDDGDLGQTFPLLAQRHPLLAKTSSQDQETRQKAWELLLQKLPMPFDVMSNPACWQWPALLPRESYNSRLTGEECTDKKLGLIAEVVAFFGFQKFFEFHDAYLHTDAAALADVMEHYRDSFYEHFRLDPALYVTHASASFDAMKLRCLPGPKFGASAGIMTDPKIYDLVRRNVRGGLSNIAQPFAFANNQHNPKHDPDEETSWIVFNDVVSMYPYLMTKPLPVDGGTWLRLPREKKERLRLLNKKLSEVDYADGEESECYMAEVSFDVPWFKHSQVDWPPVAKMSVSFEQLSDYTKSLLRNADQKISPGPKLVPYLGMHRREAVDLRYLKFIMETLGVRVFELHSLVCFKCDTWMAPFIVETFERRRTLKREGRTLQANVQKLTMNVEYGKMVQNQEAFRNSLIYFNSRKFEKKAGKPEMLNLHFQIVEENAFMGIVDVAKTGTNNILQSFPQGGWKILEESRLLMLRLHYEIRRIFDGDLTHNVDPVPMDPEKPAEWQLRPTSSRVRWLGGDTDSSAVQIFDGRDPKHDLAARNALGGDLFFDVAGDAKGAALEEHLADLDPANRETALARAGELGNFADEAAPLKIVEWVGVGPKMYSVEKSDGKNKSRAKGVPKVVRKTLKHQKFRDMVEKHHEHSISFNRLQSKNHVMEVVPQTKKGLSAVNLKVYQLNAYQSRPLGHYKNILLLAETVEKLQHEQHLVHRVLSYITGDVGFLCREPGSTGSFKGKLMNLSYVGNGEELENRKRKSSHQEPSG